MALREIRRNMLRSSLTMLGIVIGVGAVIALVTLGEGATRKVTSDISQLGVNLLTRHARARCARPGERARRRRSSLDDATRDRARGPSAISASRPRRRAALLAVYGNQNWNTSVHRHDQRLLRRCATSSIAARAARSRTPS